jgi:hypothetical protein
MVTSSPTVRAASRSADSRFSALRGASVLLGTAPPGRRDRSFWPRPGTGLRAATCRYRRRPEPTARLGSNCRLPGAMLSSDRSLHPRAGTTREIGSTRWSSPFTPTGRDPRRAGEGSGAAGVQQFPADLPVRPAREPQRGRPSCRATAVRFGFRDGRPRVPRAASDLPWFRGVQRQPDRVGCARRWPRRSDLDRVAEGALAFPTRYRTAMRSRTAA